MNIINSIKMIAMVALVTLTVSTASAAYVAPTGNPTGGNPPAPLNVGSVTQDKVGGLTLLDVVVDDFLGLGGWGALVNTDGNGRISLYSSAAGNTYLKNERASRISLHTNGIRFFTAPAGNIGSTVPWGERLRIDHSGYVGASKFCSISGTNCWDTSSPITIDGIDGDTNEILRHNGNTWESTHQLFVAGTSLPNPALYLLSNNNILASESLYAIDNLFAINGYVQAPSIRANEYCDLSGNNCSTPPFGGGDGLPEGQLFDTLRYDGENWVPTNGLSVRDGTNNDGGPTVLIDPLNSGSVAIDGNVYLGNDDRLEAGSVLARGTLSGNRFCSSVSGVDDCFQFATNDNTDYISYPGGLLLGDLADGTLGGATGVLGYDFVPGGLDLIVDGSAAFQGSIYVTDGNGFCHGTSGACFTFAENTYTGYSKIDDLLIGTPGEMGGLSTFIGSSNPFGPAFNFGAGTGAFLGNLWIGQELNVGETIAIRGGNPGNNKVLTSDANGLARWESVYNVMIGSQWNFEPGPGDQSCTPFVGDYSPQNWSLSLSEILRLIQYYNVPGYHPDASGEDGFEPGFPDTDYIINTLPEDMVFHDADFNKDFVIGFNELQAVLTLYRAGAYHCAQ